jgi:carboxymethylenebutenolidase
MPSFTETLTVNGQQMEMYASVPSGPGAHPAVVIAFHVGGVDEFDKVMADRLAAEGYVAVVPDLFHRLTPEALNGPRLGRLDHLSDPDIIADMNAAVDFLQGHSAVDSDRIGVTGFCMGGRVAWLMAAVNPMFKCAVPFYGGNIMTPWGAATKPPFELSSGINCPMLFHFGATDGNPSPEDQAKLDAELTRLGKPHQFYSYPGAGHAFMDFTNPDRYHEAAAKAAWPRTLEFFATHLKGAAVSR